MNSSLIKLLLFVIAGVIYPMWGFAMPTVSGNTLSWPADGWYQVQSAENYETVCEGVVSADAGLDGGPCLVDSGRYIVINHSSGERFENVVVEAASDSSNAVMVNGNLISWPNDGWYQVQDANSYATVCEGGRQCSVASGIYTVINHTTGERFAGIRVGAEPATDPDQPGPGQTGVVGQLISWPDDGWYQVQNAIDYTTVCEGGRECQVQPGSYIVINHSSGERRYVDVGGDPLTGSETVRVEFDITVPAYSSDELQVRLQWGGQNFNAAWVIDESWSASADFPVNTTDQLIVTFNDRNGELTLGNVEVEFATGAGATQSLSIAASQFDTDRWDSDGDSVSNLDELRSGTDPLADEFSELDYFTEPRLELIADKTFRFSWEARDEAEYYRLMENPDGVSGFTQIGFDFDASILTFDHRVALYERVNAQYLVQACNGSGCVDSDILYVSGSLAAASGYFKASNTGDRDKFGSTVVLSADGNTMVVASPDEDSASTGINGDQHNDGDGGALSGAVYVFARSEGSWQQQAYIKASNTDVADGFGEAQVLARFNGPDGNIGLAISLSGDGNTLVVGAAREDSSAVGINGNQADNSATDAGAVYVFERSDGVWSQRAYIKASNTQSGDLFGSAVILNAAGDTLVVGAPAEDSLATGVNSIQDNNGANLSGAAYVFVRSGSGWQQQAYLKAGNALPEDQFGSSFSLSADGNTLAVGATRRGYYAGAVYMFERIDSTWQQRAFLQASLDHQDFFGSSISLSADGQTMAVGAPGEASAAVGINGDQSDNSLFYAGAVHVYVRRGGQWQHQAFVKASNTQRENMFGAAVSLSANGGAMAVGALRGGAVYVYTLRDAAWQELTLMNASDWTDSAPLLFGASVSLDATGTTLAVGAPGDRSTATGINGNQLAESNEAWRAGSVYLY